MLLSVMAWIFASATVSVTEIFSEPMRAVSSATVLVFEPAAVHGSALITDATASRIARGELIAFGAVPARTILPASANASPSSLTLAPSIASASANAVGSASPTSYVPARPADPAAGVLTDSAQQLCYPSAFVFDPARGADVFQPALLAEMRGMTLLSNAAVVPPAQLREFVAENPKVIADLIYSPPSAVRAGSWWSSLSEAQQTSLVSAAPEVIGNLEGVPMSVRDRANRTYLTESMDALVDRLERGVGRGVQRDLLRTLRMLRAVEDALGTEKSVPERHLLTLDTVYPGRAAIALGDLSSADYVSYIVPGMFITIDEQIGDWTDAAARLYAEQASFEAVFEEEATVATVAWIGYHTPHVMNVGGRELAEQGANYLANSLDGIRAIRASDEPHVSVIAHSYGSTAALMALTDGAKADALALVGSPGSAAQHVSELAVPADDVYVGEAGWDPIVDSAFFGSDPGAASFGAKKLSVAGSIDRLTGKALSGSTGHNEYFSPGTEAMRNMALIGIDKGQWVTEGTALDAQKTLALAG
ncbi:alpha/beta hydrolase [Planctomonas psychrotolerans]|uniref:alpha/beta hydrolase n=1 Tax=Planctomonas psychrotolerans TaxID=2528712 RepID=UPI001D0D2F1B|nr:alpha/beta hydrolase [Planctomonas psychrotolerans]